MSGDATALLARAASAWACRDAAGALAAWREVARLDPSLLPRFAAGTAEALLVDAARFTPVAVPELPLTETLPYFDPGQDDVDTNTPGTRAALAWVAPPGTYGAYEPLARRPLVPGANPETGRRGSLVAGTAGLALASGGLYLLAMREEAAYFDPDTDRAELPETRANTNRMVGLSGVLAAGGLALGATAIVTW